jgi:hypothetical protein
MGSTNLKAGSMGNTKEADMLASVFESLEGSWTLERRLNSANASEPSGRCHGVVRFTSRPPSTVGSDIQGTGEVVGEMLYHEEGQFQMQASSVRVQMPYTTFARNYVWRLNSAVTESGCPSCSVWFAKPGTEELDYLFHALIIDGQSLSQQSDKLQQRTSIIRAHGSHLCVEDQYETEYVFTFTEHDDRAKISLVEWQTVHTVKGPKKEQRIETTFTRAHGLP